MANEADFELEKAARVEIAKHGWHVATKLCTDVDDSPPCSIQHCKVKIDKYIEGDGEYEGIYDNQSFIESYRDAIMAIEAGNETLVKISDIPIDKMVQPLSGSTQLSYMVYDGPNQGWES